jgi:hypothetical protein
VRRPDAPEVRDKHITEALEWKRAGKEAHDELLHARSEQRVAFITAALQDSGIDTDELPAEFWKEPLIKVGKAIADWDALKPKVLALIKQLQKRQKHERTWATFEDFTDEIVALLRRDGSTSDFAPMPTPLDLLDFEQVRPFFASKKVPSTEQWQAARDKVLKEARKWQRSVKSDFVNLLPAAVVNDMSGHTPLFQRATTVFLIKPHDTPVLTKKRTSKSTGKKPSFSGIYDPSTTRGLSADEVLHSPVFHQIFDPKLNRGADGRAYVGTKHIAYDKAAVKVVKKVIELAGLSADATAADLDGLGKRFTWKLNTEKKVQVVDYKELVRSSCLSLRGLHRDRNPS